MSPFLRSKRTITSHLNSLNTKNTTTYDVGQVLAPDMHKHVFHPNRN